MNKRLGKRKELRAIEESAECGIVKWETDGRIDVVHSDADWPETTRAFGYMAFGIHHSSSLGLPIEIVLRPGQEKMENYVLSWFMIRNKWLRIWR